jgi:hypothetical protein
MLCILCAVRQPMSLKAKLEGCADLPPQRYNCFPVMWLTTRWHHRHLQLGVHLSMNQVLLPWKGCCLRTSACCALLQTCPTARLDG